MHKKLISIIVPIYNPGNFLERCINSIINQTYKNIQIILVNDGSTDGSLEICKKYEKIDKRIVLYNQPNKGVSIARNKGLDLAKGEYVIFVDSDDELMEYTIDCLYEAAITHNADIACGLQKIVSHKDEVVNEAVLKETYLYGDDEIVELAINGSDQSACCKLFKANQLKNLRFEEGKAVNEDSFFIFQCYIEKPKVVKVNRILYKYNVRKGSASRSEFSIKYLDIFYFLDRKKELVNNRFPEYAHLLNDLEMRTHLLFLQILCRTNEKKYRIYEKNSICKVKELYKKIDKSRQSLHEKRVSFIVNYGLFSVYKKLIRIYRK